MAGLFDFLQQGTTPDAGRALAQAASTDPQGTSAMSQPQSPNFDLGAMFNGDAMFADRSRDNQIDSETGLPVSVTRKANSKSLLNASLMLLAAGSATDGNARAQILSGLPAAIDSSTNINNFARARLEMAKARLADITARSEASREAAFGKMLGQDGSPAPAGGAGLAPVAPATVPPSMAGLPMLATPNMQQAGADAGGPAPVPLPTAPMAPVPAPTSAAGLPSVTPPVPNAPPQPVGLTPADLPVGLPKSAPPPPTFNPLTDLTPKERVMIAGMGKDEGFKELAKRSDAKAGQEYAGTPYTDPTTGHVMLPRYQRGVLTNTTDQGPAEQISSIQKDPLGNVIISKIDPATGKTTDQKIDQMPSDKQAFEMNKFDTERLGKRADTLQTQYEPIANAGQSYSRINETIANIKNGQMNIGPAGNLKQKTATLFQSLGLPMSQETQQVLANTNDAGAIIKSAAADLARFNNPGGRITDADQKLANQIVTGLDSDPVSLQNGLLRMRETLRNKVEQYNKQADTHNSMTNDIAGKHAPLYSVPRIEGDFTSEPDGTKSPSWSGRPDAAPPPVGVKAPQAAAPDLAALARAEIARRKALAGSR